MTNDGDTPAGEPQDGPGNEPDNPFRGTPFEQFFSSMGPGGLPDLSSLDLNAIMGQMQSLLAPYDGPDRFW